MSVNPSTPGNTSVDSLPHNPTSTSASNLKPLQVKLVLLGEAAVGKSSLVLRFVHDEFQENKEPTIGAAFLAQKCRVEDKVIKFEIWDTAGQERFHSLAPMYYRNAQAAVVVYDVTKAVSLDKAKTWVKELQRQANPNIVIALAGNKVDLVTPNADEEDNEQHAVDDATNSANSSRKYGRQVPTEEARAYANEAGLLFFETSAKNGDGIVEVFTEIAKKIAMEDIMSGTQSRTGAGGALNSGNGRIDLLREGGGAGSFGTFGEGRSGRNRTDGNCAC